MQGRKRNLGFVELPDHALDLLSVYTQRPDWEVVLVIGHARESHVMRMAEILQVPTLNAPERLSLIGCDRVIAGDDMLSLTRSVLEGTHVEVVPLADALAEARSQATLPAAPVPEASPVAEPAEEPLWEYRPIEPIASDPSVFDIPAATEVPPAFPEQLAEAPAPVEHAWTPVEEPAPAPVEEPVPAPVEAAQPPIDNAVYQPPAEAFQEQPTPAPVDAEPPRETAEEPCRPEPVPLPPPPAPEATAPVGDRWEKALIEVDQLMATEENLSARLQGVAASLGKTLAADFAHFFLVDSLAKRLTLVTPARGTTTWQPETQPLNRGFLGAMVRLREPRILGVFNERGERRAALICIPIQSMEPRALIVLENVPVSQVGEEDVLKLLREVVAHTEELIATEEGVVAQELLYQLKMRVTDQIPQLAALPPVQRTRAALELALQNLAAEVAIWIPQAGGRPIATEPRSARAVSILGQVRWSLDRIAAWVNGNGSVAVGLGGDDEELDAPKGPVPYIGAKSPDGEGVLIAFFPPDEVTGSPAQVPVHVLLEVGHHIAEICSSKTLDAPTAPTPVPMPEAVFGPQDFRLLTRQEWLRSRRYGHSFALTRFRLPDSASAEGGVLREFLLARKRDVDLLTEVEPACFIVLSPEVDQNPEGIRYRLLREWSESFGHLPMEAEQRIFPRDGHDESIYVAWALQPAAQRAA